MSLCPACAYREAEDDGWCEVCSGQIAFALGDSPRPCQKCSSTERNSAGDCARCHRARERARYQPTGRKRGRLRINMICTECDRPAVSRGLCRPHYLRQWRKAA